MLGHVEKLQKIPGASLAFGGKKLEGHTIPERYGAIVPTAVFVPLKEILKPENFDLVTTEVFGPVQVYSLLHLCLLKREGLGSSSIAPLQTTRQGADVDFQLSVIGLRQAFALQSLTQLS